MGVNYIPIINGKEAAKVKVNDIVLIERDKRKLRVVTDRHVYNVYEKIDNMIPMLSDEFYQCRQGLYINLSKVSYMSDQKICFDNGEVYYIGRDSFIKAKQKYSVYLRSMVK